jgi:hypothetical protein
MFQVTLSRLLALVLVWAVAFGLLALSDFAERNWFLTLVLILAIAGPGSATVLFVRNRHLRGILGTCVGAFVGALIAFLFLPPMVTRERIVGWPWGIIVPGFLLGAAIGSFLCTKR